MKQMVIDLFEQRSPDSPMDKDETMFFMNLLLTEEQEFNTPIEDINKKSKIYQHFKPVINGFQIQVFLKRLECMTTLKITLGALIILAYHLKNAGSAVMYSFYLHNKLPPNTIIGINTISTIFPWGFFSEEQLKEIWNGQKVDVDDCKEFTCMGAFDNMIDYIEIWK